jgi:predicted amidophosphoribosyltransferase
MWLLADLVDLVMPADCLCCGRAGAVWCPGCQPASVPRRVAQPATPAIFAAGEYAEQLRTALIAYKERGRRQLAGQLAGYLADAVDCAVRAVGGPAPPVLVPVPSRRAAARARGGDHVLRLARTVARQAGLPMLRALALTGRVTDSAGLSVEQRRANLAGRMAAIRPPVDRCPILLDDIVTTGATLAEAGRALAAAGWPPAGAAVIAATRLRRAVGTVAAELPDRRAPPSSAATEP